MTAVEVKGGDPKNTWEIVGIYRAPNEDTRVLEKLADRTVCSGRTTKCSIIGGDLNLPFADWNGHAEKSRGTQEFLNRLAWENGYTQVINSPSRGDALLDIFLVRPETAFTSCSNIQGISGHCGVLWEVEWGENSREYKVESLVPVYHETNVPGLKSFLSGEIRIVGK